MTFYQETLNPSTVVLADKIGETKMTLIQVADMTVTAQSLTPTSKE